jgi:hypothetical protein
VTVQPAIDEPFFEMENAYNWFSAHCAKTSPADLIYPGCLSAPPGYSDLQESRLKADKGVGVFDNSSVAWHHFLIPLGRQWPDFVLAVLLGMRSPVLLPYAVDQWSELPLVWRVWLYEHYQDRGWVCLDPRDESCETVRQVRAWLLMEALAGRTL